jgi:hypothetical protein
MPVFVGESPALLIKPELEPY